MKNGIPDLNDIYHSIGKIEGNLEEFTKKVDRCIENHENRLNNIEKCVDKMEGKATAIGAIAGFIVSIVAVIISLLKKDLFH